MFVFLPENSVIITSYSSVFKSLNISKARYAFINIDPVCMIQT